MSKEPTQPAMISSFRGPSLFFVALAHTALFAASLVIAGTGGVSFSTPWNAPPIVSLMQSHAYLRQIMAFFQFGSAIPLAIFAATAVSRLHFYGVRVAGVTIALVGGLCASLMLVLSALLQWTIATPAVAESEPAV